MTEKKLPSIMSVLLIINVKSNYMVDQQYSTFSRRTYDCSNTTLLSILHCPYVLAMKSIGVEYAGGNGASRLRRIWPCPYRKIRKLCILKKFIGIFL